MKKLSIQVAALCSVFGFVNNVSATDCITAPDCATLGYTVDASSCSGAALYCPWDLSKAACEPGILSVTCVAGSLLGGDRRCYSPDSGTPEGVEPIGVVFDPENSLAVALTDINSDGSAGSSTMYWSDVACGCEILETQCSDINDCASYGTNGRTNTDAILASTCNGTSDAAKGTNAYEPSGCSADFCKAGKWFLPSFRDLVILSGLYPTINGSLSSASGSGAKTLTADYYWPSSSFDACNGWLFNPIAKQSDNTGKDNPFYVRPVVYYGTGCQIENCALCEDGVTDSCGLCKIGYSQYINLATNRKACSEQLDTDVDDSNTFTCSDSLVQTTCNGMTCCCPADDLCGSSSGNQCICDSSNVY